MSCIDEGRVGPAPLLDSEVSLGEGDTHEGEEDTYTPPPVTLSARGTIRSASALGPIAGAIVCAAHDAEQCVTAADDGSFEINGVHAGSRLQVSAEGFRPSTVYVDVGQSEGLLVPLVSEHAWELARVSHDLSGSGGVVGLFRHANGDFQLLTAGVNPRLEGYSGLGPLVNVSGTVSREPLTATDGIALYLDAMPGPYHFKAEHADGSCTPSYGHEDPEGLVNAQEAGLTVIGFDCAVTSPSNLTVAGDVVHGVSLDPLVGAEVCFTGALGGQSHCGLASEGGGFVLENLPFGARGVLTVSHPGFVTTRSPINTNAGHPISLSLTPVNYDWGVGPGSEEPDAEGRLLMHVYDATSLVEAQAGSLLAQGGVSIGLLPVAGAGPFYLVEPGTYSPIAPATFESGIGMVSNLPSGNYRAKFEHPAGSCVVGNGLPVREDGSFEFAIQGGAETHVSAFCTVATSDTATVLGRMLNALTVPATPLDEGEVCWVEQPSEGKDYEEKICAQADENGDFELSDLPANTAIRLRVTSPGYDTNDFLVNTRFGLTYNPVLTPSVLKEFVMVPLWEAGLCPPMDNVVTYDGKSFISSRAYDAAHNSDTFFQALWIPRARMLVERVDVEAPPINTLYFGPSFIDMSRDESGVEHGAMMVCSIEPGSYRVSWTHPWGECRIGNGNTPEPDGSFVVNALGSNLLGLGAVCDLEPPGTLVEELASYPPISATHQAFESAGLLPGLEPSTTPDALLQHERTTIFAPSDGALASYLLAAGSLSDDALRVLMQHHIVDGEVERHELVGGGPFWTRAGEPLTFVEDEDGEIRVKGTTTRVIEYEHWALDGNIYVLDGVLSPGSGGPAELAEVDAGPAVAQLIGHVQHTHETWESGGLSSPKYAVYTPPGYYEDLPGGYPVVYLLHDLGGDHMSLLGGPTQGVEPEGSLDAIVEELLGAGAMPPVILVGLNGMSRAYGSFFMDSTSESGEGVFGAFQSYVKAVMSEVESTYNTATDMTGPDNRALVGVGMGAFGAVHLATSDVLFDAIILHSGILDVADLAQPDEAVSANYPGGGVNGSLWSEVLAEWTALYGDVPIDGRLSSAVGHDNPAISRLVAMASVFSPRKAFFVEFDQAGSSLAGRSAGLVTDIDGDASNNYDYPMALVSAGGDGLIDDEYLGYQLPWSATGVLNPVTWQRWVSHDPKPAFEASAMSLLTAGTRLYLDCGAADERGLADQTQAFSAMALTSLGADRVTVELYDGASSALIYKERLRESMLWLGGVWADKGAP